MIARVTRSLKVQAVLGLSLSLFSLSLAQPTPVSVHGQLRVQGNRIVNKDGVPVALHGMSMYAWAQQGLQFYNATAIRRLVQEWKCTVIRIPILPNNVGTQTNQVKTVVDACIANGVYAILDWHSMEGANAGAASAYFKDMAAANPITLSTNIAYSLHFYAASHKQSIRASAAAALSRGIALFSTEYGTSEASGTGTFDAAETQLWWNFLHANGIGSANWSVSALDETSAAFKNGTSATNWTDSNLKPSGSLVKAFIMSKYDVTVTVGIKGEESNPGRFAIGKEMDFSAAAAQAYVYTVLGTRITKVAKSLPANGSYILRGGPDGKVKGLALIR